MRGFMEEVQVAERVVMVVNVPREVKCPMCRETIRISNSKKFTRYINQNKKGQEPIGVSKDRKLYKKWLGMKRLNKKKSLKRAKKREQVENERQYIVINKSHF